MTEKPPPRRHDVTQFYRDLMRVIDRRIRALALTMEQVDDLAGLPDRYTAKMLHPDAPSGRQARWETLQLAIETLYPGGVRITLTPLDRTILDRLSIKFPDPDCLSNTRRIDLIALARKGGLAGSKARAEKLTPERRSEIARAAVQTRWARHRANEGQPNGRA